MDSVKRSSAFRMNGGWGESAKKLVSEVRIIESRIAEFLSQLDVTRDALVIQHVAASLAEVAQFLQQANHLFAEQSNLCGTKVGLEELTPASASQRFVS